MRLAQATCRICYIEEKALAKQATLITGLKSRMTMSEKTCLSYPTV